MLKYLKHGFSALRSEGLDTKFQTEEKDQGTNVMCQLNKSFRRAFLEVLPSGFYFSLAQTVTWLFLAVKEAGKYNFLIGYVVAPNNSVLLVGRKGRMDIG